MVLNAGTKRWSTLWSLALIAALLATVAAIPLEARTAQTRNITQVYVAGAGGVDGVDNCEAHTGGACFPLLGDELQAAIAVVDDSGRQPTNGTYRFRDDAGTLLAEGQFCETTVAPVPPEAARLDVFVAAFDVLACGEPTVGSTGKIHVRYQLSAGDFAPIEVEPQECIQPTPAAISVAGLTEPDDVGQRIDLDVYVLLDGVSQQRGREIMERSADAYTPLGIDLRFRYKPVTLPPASNGQLMISHAINAVGGEVPKGFDVVHALTSRSMNVSGQADCLGGVRYRDRAFSVSTAMDDRNFIYVPGVEGKWIADYAAKIVAHEIGHLMGGHHHHGSCVESQVNEPESCTVMTSPSPVPLLLRFSSVNGAIVRAHAVRYASP